ncbi:MAG: hypothetical protein ACOC34_02825 [Thermotogota bacterium]
MSSLFDALFFPIAFFKRTECAYSQSFIALIIIIAINLLSDRRILGTLFSFFGITAFLFVILIPIFVLLLLFGLDLLLIREDKNHWIKTHMAFTYVPYLFFPLVRPLVERRTWQFQFFGWIVILLMCLWSYSLLELLLKKSEYAIIRFFRDVCLLILLVVL